MDEEAIADDIAELIVHPDVFLIRVSPAVADGAPDVQSPFREMLSA